MNHYNRAQFMTSMRSTCDDSDVRNAETLRLLREFTGERMLFDKMTVYDLINTMLPDHLIVRAQWSETYQEWYAAIIGIADDAVTYKFVMPCVDQQAALGLALAKAEQMRCEVMERGL